MPKETSADGQGHLRIETGNGAEGFITDATTGQIRDEAIPFFQRQDYGGGIELMTLRVAERFATRIQLSDRQHVAPAAGATAGQGSARRRAGGIPPFVYLIILFVILSMLRRTDVGVARLSADLHPDSVVARWRWSRRSGRRRLRRWWRIWWIGGGGFGGFGVVDGRV